MPSCARRNGVSQRAGGRLHTPVLELHSNATGLGRSVVHRHERYTARCRRRRCYRVGVRNDVTVRQTRWRSDKVRADAQGLPVESRGWLSGLRDPHIGKALRLSHARSAEGVDPNRARSRPLAHRVRRAFSDCIGVPPQHYLKGWRPQLARRQLRRASASCGWQPKLAMNPKLPSIGRLSLWGFRQAHGAKSRLPAAEYESSDPG